MVTKSDLDSIPGWFFREDVALSRFFLDAQARFGVTSDLVEVVAYAGKGAATSGQAAR